MSEPAKKASSKVGSNVSKMSEQRRLEIQAELMDKKSQMEIEKMERDLKLETIRREMELELEKTRRELETDKKLQELQAESEIAELKRKKAFERQQLLLQIQEAEGSNRASSICPSLMSLTLEEDKNSEIKSWLDQGVEDLDKCASHNRRNLAEK